MARVSARLLLATIAFCLVALLVGRDHPLQNLNEGIYARVAQEMLERGDFVVPTLDGVPYLEKPPLLYWVTAAGYAILGTHEAAVRLAPLFGTVLTLAATAWFARRHLGIRSTYFAVTIVTSMPIVLVLGRTLLFDMLFTGLLFASFVALYETLTRPAEARWLRWSYALLAGAILAKGLAALVFYLLVVAAAVLPTGPAARLTIVRRLADPLAVAILLALAVPWHVVVGVRHPDFVWFYFVNEHLLRFFDARVPHDYHTGAWWYFLPRIPLDIFPWTLLLLLPNKRAVLTPEEASARRFLWIALLVPLVVYSLSIAKGEYYLVVGAPPLALLAADRLVRARAVERRNALVAIALSFAVVIAVLASVSSTQIAPYAMPGARMAVLVTVGAAVIVALLAAFRRRPALAVLACAAASLPCIAFYSEFFRVNEPLKSALSLAFELNRAPAPVYVYREFESLSALPFYLDAPVGVVDSRSTELWYGSRLEPQPERFPDMVAMRKLAASEPLWLVVPMAESARFANSGLETTFVAERAVGSNELYASQPLADELARERALRSVARAGGAAR